MTTKYKGLSIQSQSKGYIVTEYPTLYFVSVEVAMKCIDLLDEKEGINRDFSEKVPYKKPKTKLNWWYNFFKESLGEGNSFVFTEIIGKEKYPAARSAIYRLIEEGKMEKLTKNKQKNLKIKIL